MKLKNKKWTYGFLGLAVVVIATIAYAAAGDRYIYNQNQDKDINIVVNDGGVDTTVLTAEGATSKVGINTQTPAGLLHIQQREADSNDDGIVLDAAGSGSARFYLDGTNLRFYKSGSTAMTIDNGANVSVENSISSPVFSGSGTTGQFRGEYHKVEEGSFHASFYVVVSGFVDETCSTTCGNASSKLTEIGADTGVCLAGWRRGTAASIGCGNGTSGFSNVCLCVGGRAP